MDDNAETKKKSFKLFTASIPLWPVLVVLFAVGIFIFFASKLDNAATMREVDTANNSDNEASSIQGTWVMAARGGEDGQTKCRDFAAPALYQLNGETGMVAEYDAHGSYRAFLAYTPPSGDGHRTTYTATWRQMGSQLILENKVARDAFVDGPFTDKIGLRFVGANAVLIDEIRYVRCIGPTELDTLM